MNEIVLSVSDFVGLLNQTLEFAYPNVSIVGELANLRVSKGRWLYFDLKDELSSVKFFGTIYNLPGPLEDGMLLKVRGQPRLHPQYGFSINVQNIQPAGEGSIKKAAALLEAKLKAEGLFEPSRKRVLPHAPNRIGLIASSESAAYHDFIKIIKERWGGVNIELADVQVQGELAPGQIIEAIEYFNQAAETPEVLVITRGGGSAEDLAAFSTEQVTRAVAASRIPTIVAIGHEIDISLAELAADLRASTPSNAAQLLVPDKRQISQTLAESRLRLGQLLSSKTGEARQNLAVAVQLLHSRISQLLRAESDRLLGLQKLLAALNPEVILRRGYAVVRQNGKVIRSVKAVHSGSLNIQLADGSLETQVK